MWRFLTSVKQFYETCAYINPEDDNLSKQELSLLSQHPELAYYSDDICVKKVGYIFSNYPCNCREMILMIHNNSFNFTHLENIFESFTMLEAFYVNYNISNHESSEIMFNFTKKQLALPFLRIFNVNGVNIGYIDNEIGELTPNLEIFRVNNVLSSFCLPWIGLAKLNKLKAVHLEHLDDVASFITDGICNLDELLYFTHSEITYNDELMRQLRINDTMISFPGCIGTRWQSMEHFHVMYSLQINYIPSTIFNLPNIKTVQLSGVDINVTMSFQDFTDYNSDIRIIYVSGSPCDSSGIMSNVSQLEYFAISQQNEQLLKLIDIYGPCYDPCSIDIVGCTQDIWYDGVCDSVCNIESCDYDGGDCNQLCQSDNSQCTTELLFNNECNNECNSSLCAWDLYHCAHGNDTCYSESQEIVNEIYYIFDINDTMNYSYVYTSTVDRSSTQQDMNTCYVDWILGKDQWCDDNCRYHESCEYDNYICSQCSGLCRTYFNEVMVEFANEVDPLRVFTVEELCLQWQEIKLRHSAMRLS